MKCPTCQKEMEERGSQITNNGKEEKAYKEYKRITYWCKKDDIWITVETPLPALKHITK
ncbi:MAG TPA: hypothetical protein VMR41_00700 [Patescibacteria group bacterium]|nr:hypothetical protein [Patescibacteria group bacterium]